MSELRFDGRVAIVTGAGNGLGRAHALLLASRGAKVVVNDLGGASTGGGKSSEAADRVVKEIKDAGGEAVANYDSVEDGAKIAQCALDNWKQCDILINNAGILRDTSFQKMTQDDWDLVYRVHVLGAFRLTHALWSSMRDRGYGRILFTASAAGIYGNFGQANYSMAKLGLLGFSNTLAIEGKKKGVLVNTIAPIAGSRMTETILPPEMLEALKPEYVSALAAWLVHESCTENGGLFEVGGGLYTKLRWERTEGKTFKMGRVITPEDVASAWPAVTDFSKATHPGDVTQSMQPILGNLSTKSRGGNAMIDADAAWGYEFPVATSSYDERDVALYALGVGAAKNALDPSELPYVYEMHSEGMKVLPTFGVVPGLKVIFDMYKEGKAAPGLNYGFERVLHGEQYLEVKRPLPQRAKLTHKAKIKDIFDKGKNALVVTEIVSTDERGQELFTNEVTTFVRGAGGWGGDRGPAQDVNVAPERAPDATASDKIDENQALLYRLSGDINPLHADPAFAKNFGFERPILHGLCTFGYAARHVIKAFAKNGDPRFFKSIKVRFSDTVFPGETLITEMWKESDTRILFRCRIKERDKVVISNAAIELFTEIPVEKSAPVKIPVGGATTAPAPEPSGEPTSREGFMVIKDYIESHADLVAQVGRSYVFKLTDPNSAWTIDLKNGKGGVTEGESPADCTLEFSDADFRDMMMGKADAQKMYFAGKLKIGGDLMASQKLFFLKKIDQKRAVEVVTKLRSAAGGPATGGASAAAAPTASGPSKKEPHAPMFIASLKERMGKAKDVDAIVWLRVTDPPASFTLDFKVGEVREGEPTPRDVTLTLKDDALATLARDGNLRALYQMGGVRIDGDMKAAQRLTFFKAPT